jgi:ElaB/YqjD/DUF883 family membrane-anchored ribosome-binding protein
MAQTPPQDGKRSGKGKPKSAAATRAATFERQASQTGLLLDLDRLAQKIDEAARQLEGLRTERDTLSTEVDRLSEECERLLRVAGVVDADALMQRMARMAELERVNRALEKERGETVRRLGAVIEKVDLLREDA